MTTLTRRPTQRPVLRTDDAFLAEPVHEETPRHTAYRYTRPHPPGLGWVFLWAFLDKTFGLGFGTGLDAETGVVDRFGDAAWINGGSPTLGFLNFGATGRSKVSTTALPVTPGPTGCSWLVCSPSALPSSSGWPCGSLPPLGR